MIYNVVAISGSNGQLISETIQKFGCISHYGTRVTAQDTAILITYPWELYGYVMTQHWIVNVLEPYNRGEVQNYTDWIPRFYKHIDYKSPNDISYEEWAHHVIDAYKHIGTGDPLNGVKSSLVKRIPTDTTYHEIKLSKIIYNPYLVLEQLSQITQKNLTPDVQDFFIKELESMHNKMKPYLNEIDDTKSNYVVDETTNKLVFNYVKNLGYCGIHPKE